MFPLDVAVDIVVNNTVAKTMLCKGRVVVVAADVGGSAAEPAPAAASAVPTRSTSESAAVKKPERLPSLPGVLLHLDTSVSPPALIVLVECPAGFVAPVAAAASATTASGAPKPDPEATKGLKVLKKKGDDDDDDFFGGGGGKKGGKGGKGGAASSASASAAAAVCVATGWFGTVGATTYTIVSVPLQALQRVSSLLCKQATTYEPPKGIPVNTAKDTATFIDDLVQKYAAQLLPAFELTDKVHMAIEWMGVVEVARFMPVAVVLRQRASWSCGCGCV